MGHNNIPNKMKNPLLDINEDISPRPGQNLPFFEKIGLVSALIISAAILIFSSLSLLIDLFVKLDIIYSLIDLLIIMVSLTSIYYIINAFKKRIVNELLIDTAFQDGLYTRLQPLIENIAQAHVGANIILDKIYDLDLKVQTLLKEQYKEEITAKSIAVGSSIKFTIKFILLITITMAAFMFLLNFNLGGVVPYGVLLVFVMWWGFITAEYNLWKETAAWTAVFFLILVIPITVMLLGTLLNANNVLMAAMYVAVGLYTFAYYVWAVYATTGSLPIIISNKQETTGSEFFALQQRGMIRESLDAIFARIEQKLRDDEKKQESGYVWKK